MCFFNHCGNIYLKNSYSQHVGKIAALRTHLSTKQNHTRLSLKEHGEIVDAVVQKDVKTLEKLLNVHMGRTQKTYEIGVKDIANS
jgi:DNA-binding GntR family transcriptional regulator